MIFAIAQNRIPERDFGITGETEPPAYDEMQRYCRDHGWIPIKRVLCNIRGGTALEVGPGPGYLGLEWLKRTPGAKLVGYDISPDMIGLSRMNAGKYALEDRAEYRCGDVVDMPFENGRFDSVFSNDSFHEWVYPAKGFDEIWRVLKPGGRYCIGDLRRDMNPFLKGLIWVMCKPKSMRPGWLTSVDASYILPELHTLLAGTKLNNWHIERDALRFFIVGEKE